MADQASPPQPNRPVPLSPFPQPAPNVDDRGQLTRSVWSR